MLARVKRLFDRLEADVKAPAHNVDQLNLAAAALLVHAACVDSDFDGAERDAILDMIRGHMELAPDDAAALAEAGKWRARATSAGASALLTGLDD